MISLIAFPLSASAQGPNSAEKAQVVSAIGKVPGKDLIVHVWVVVPPGADKNEAAIKALANQGARPFTSEEFSTIALKWDQFEDNDPTNDFVTQNYNPNNDPSGQGLTKLQKTHATWNGVQSSVFVFQMGEVNSTRCPSLVKECPGRQTFDGYNDVAWVELRDKNTLGVTWSGTSIDEADMALNTKFTWNTNGNDFDIETVYLHENGHVLGLGHSAVFGAVMEPIYAGERISLHPDDEAGIAFLYPSGPGNSVPTITITSPADGSTFDSGASIDFAGTASDTEDGDITSDLVWTSDIDGQIGTGGSFSTTLSDGNHVITASATDDGGATGTDSVSITIGTVNISSTISVDSITYATEGGKNGDKHLLITIALLDNDNPPNPVSGASVSIDLYRDGSFVASGTGTTGSSGTVTFSLKNGAAGNYSTIVTAVTANGLTWDGTSPSNDFEKSNSSSKPQK